MRTPSIYLHCALVLLLSWPAPLPVVHAHSDYLADAGNCRQLAIHLALYHQSQEPEAVNLDTPHCHWLFVWAGLDTPMQAAPVDDEGGDAGRLAPPGSFSPTLGVDATISWSSVLSSELRGLRLVREYSNGQADAVGLAFHRVFCVWNC